MSAVHLDLSPLMLTAIGLVVYGVTHRWVDRRRRASTRRTGATGTPASSRPLSAVDDVPELHGVDDRREPHTVDDTTERPVRRWWRNPVGAVPIVVGLVMIVGYAAVERAFGTVISIAASLFLPGR
ncbi:hypothetical protein [Cellulomonas sp. P24]|uniref:hypothetical protein n=1 Tax=Cellulomonas sp. P24 TaxID=2885206 RepID=UPI00216B49C9|nr:hypothetical protein [Cellulomonas sp. P24]MCR6492912.1 hypothetical protein [Cellulomonas sp. P24]